MGSDTAFRVGKMASSFEKLGSVSRIRAPETARKPRWIGSFREVSLPPREEAGAGRTLWQ